MIRKVWNLIRSRTTWIILGATIILAALNLAFLGSSFQKNQQAVELQGQVEELTANLEQLREAEREGLQSLEDQLSEAEAQRAALEASFPEIGTAFDLYRRGFDLAEMSNVELLSVRRLGGTTQATVVGTLDVVSYNVQSTGDLWGCLSLLSQLEREGLQTLALNRIFIDLTDDACNFDVSVASANMADAP